MIYCGVDIGASSIEIVLFDGAQIIGTIVTDSGTSPIENGRRAFERALEAAEVSPEEVIVTVATGYGRNYFESAQRSCSEIICHARGVSYLFPSACTVIDIGGQDSKLIEMDGSGRPVDFVMNDRCAAGTGRFIEMTGNVIGIPVESMNESVSPDDGHVDISSMCAVFAESEIIGLLQGGCKPQVILNGVFRAVARRTMSMAGRAKVRKEVVFTGGVAKIKGVALALQKETGIEMRIPHNPQITGALGAAIIASEKAAPTF